MSLDFPREMLASEFNTKFATAYPSVPILWENQRSPPQVNVASVMVEVVPGVSRRIDVSRSVYEESGTINVAVLVPVDTGTKELNAMASIVRSILLDREWSTTGGKLVTYGMERRRRGAVNGTYGHLILVDYKFTEAVPRL